jgi:4-hydroxybenzoate polyprenyltransferase
MPITSSPLPTPAPVPPRSKLSIYLDLVRFNRPAGWLVLVWPTLAALWVAAGGFPGWHLLAVFVLGTVLAGICLAIGPIVCPSSMSQSTAQPLIEVEHVFKSA